MLKFENPFGSSDESKEMKNLENLIKRADQPPTKKESDARIREIAKQSLESLTAAEKDLAESESEQKEKLRKALASLHELSPDASWEEINKQTS